MERTERLLLSAVLTTILFLIGLDIVEDYAEGASLEHLGIEAVVSVLVAAALGIVIRGNLLLKRLLKRERQDFGRYKQESERWQIEARKFLNGLSHSIDSQLEAWKLTMAEKEVAFLLLKGFSVKEIAEARGTSDNTTRAQTGAVYAKAGVNGRTELSAFFLEDLLVPASGKNESSHSAKVQ